MNKKTLIIIGAAAAAIILIISGIRLWSGEDSWICQNGGWVKHGNPSAPRPTESCGGEQNVNAIAPPVSQPVNTNTGVETEKMTVKVFFGNTKLDPQVFDCNKVFEVEREIPKTVAVARAALGELLSGPTENEKADGYITNINPRVKIQSLTIENGIARVDFDEQLEFQVGGSCRVAAISSQIRETLKQFPTVKEVIISIDGRREDILQP